MTATGEWPAARVMKLRRFGGHGAAIAVTPYLLIKIAWTFGLFLPTEQMGETGWRAINATTAVLAAVGILLALAFCRPWGERLHAWLVALPVWVGTGLLLPMLMLAPLLGPAAITRDAHAGTADLWAYEQAFIILSLVGIGVGLPLALAGYVKARWPEALSGRTHDGQAPAGHTRPLQIPLARLVAAGCIILGVVKVFWAAGGTLGIDPTMRAARDPWWHLLALSTGGWAIAGAWSVLALTARRSRRYLPPMAAAWISSGMLFAYSLYDLMLRTDPQRPALEYPLAHLLTSQAGIVLGVVMGLTILLVLHDRRHALRRQPCRSAAPVNVPAQGARTTPPPHNSRPGHDQTSHLPRSR